MIPVNYQTPNGAYDGKDRRMEPSRSTEREIGELVATVKALAENTTRQFNELSREMEKLSAQFTEYKSDHDKQSEKDYTYLDKKIGDVDKRVTDLEKAENDRKVALAATASTPFQRFLKKVSDAGATILAGGVVAFAVWLILLYLKTSGVI